MTPSESSTPGETGERTLRLWPAFVIVAAQWFLRFGLPWLVPELLPIGVLGSLAAAPALATWWLFLSGAPRRERLGTALFVALVFGLTIPLLHPSMGTGMMGLVYPLYALPVLGLAFVAWAALTRRAAPTTLGPLPGLDKV